MEEPKRTIDPEELPRRGTVNLLNAIIAPRPIAWVATLAADGTTNLAPHSYTTIFSDEPPVVGFVSIGRKDTLRNVEQLPEFVYHVAGEDLAEQMNLTSADFPPDVSEAEWAGLTTVPSDVVRVPRIAEAPVAMEAKVVDIHRILDTNNWLILGQVVRLHIAERLFEDGRIDLTRLRPIGRMAGPWYSRLGELLSMERPTYKGLLESGARPLGEKPRVP
ncbi:MAG TPA: flavin reductase family protein [Thermomicrobiales bacterium]